MGDDTDWDGLAGGYDRIVRVFDRGSPEVRRRLARDLGDAGRVLEVAAGTGQFTFDLASVADEVVATDQSPQMVARIRARVAERGVPNVVAETMSAYALDFDDGSFDGVLCANGLHVMERPERALAEMRRVLAPDGVLLVPTFLHGAGCFERALSRTLSLFSSFVAHTRFRLDELTGLVEDAGFEVTRAESLPGLFPIGYVAARKRAR
ncbi:MAG: class I SAM-dependent methyltransferase [Myxococcales bacterium]|nr:class I SAM-dependent methyltransferase [Myxococcales bacterium]